MTDRGATVQEKRYRSRRNKHGACSVCQYRERAEEGHWHCRKRPERQGGQCATDGQLPVFRLDEDVWNDPKGAR